MSHNKNNLIVSNLKNNEISEILKPYLRKWKWFAISIFTVILLAVLYILFKPKVYSIQTSVLIKDAKKMSSASGDFGVLQGLAGIGGMGTNSIENELEIFKSKSLIVNVVKDLKLQTALYSREKFYDVELYKDTSPITIHVINEKPLEDLPKKPIDISIKGDKIIIHSEELEKGVVTTFNKMISLPYANFMIVKNHNFNPKKAKKIGDLDDLYFTYSDFETAVNDIQESIDVDLMDKEATVISIATKSANIDKSKDILNGIVDSYNIEAINDKNTESKKTKDFIDERIGIISKELSNVENQKERFKLDNMVIDIGTEARINLQISTQSKARLLELDTQLELIKMLQGYINGKGNNELLPINIGLDNEAAAKNIELYNKLVIQRNKLLETATPKNPMILEINQQIDEIKLSIKESLSKTKSTLLLTKNQIDSQYGNSNNEMMKAPVQEKLFRNIERQQQIKENLYLLLLEKREEAAISLAITGNKARIIDYAYASKKPVSPKKMFILLGAMILGFSMPFVYIYLQELFNNKIISKNDIEKSSATSVLAEIPRIYKNEKQLVQINDVSPLAESFRILFTNLKFMLGKKDTGNIIMVTSSVKGEGKTFISVNLALSLANKTRKVLIIGSDIRNPQLQRYSPEMKGVHGLTEYLHGDVTDYRGIIKTSPFSPYCDIIYSGSIPPNPAELLDNGRYEELLSIVNYKYAYIILDTAPLMLVTDSLLIANNADATIYVTRSEVTEKPFIDFANKNISEQKIKNVAFVLNDVHKNNYGYGNKYGYGYNAEDQKWWKFFLKI